MTRRLLGALLVTLAACAPDRRDAQGAVDGGESRTATAATSRGTGDTAYRRRPGYVVDSAMPPAVLLERFRRGTERRTALAAAAGSREALVRAFGRAVAAGDTAALRALLVDRSEWGWLVFPESPLSRPPYGQRPDAAWLLLSAGSDKGLRRLAARGGAGRLRVLGHDCPDAAAREGANRVWRRCTARVLRAGGDTATARLFGPIVERGGRFKFLSYENDL